MYVVPHEGITFLSSRSGKTKDGRDFYTLCCYDSSGVPLTFFFDSKVDKLSLEKLNDLDTGDIIYPLLDVSASAKGFRITVAGFVNYSN